MVLLRAVCIELIYLAINSIFPNLFGEIILQILGTKDMTYQTAILILLPSIMFIVSVLISIIIQFILDKKEYREF